MNALAFVPCPVVIESDSTLLSGGGNCSLPYSRKDEDLGVGAQRAALAGRGGSGLCFLSIQQPGHRHTIGCRREHLAAIGAPRHAIDRAGVAEGKRSELRPLRLCRRSGRLRAAFLFSSSHLTGG